MYFCINRVALLLDRKIWNLSFSQRACNYFSTYLHVINTYTGAKAKVDAFWSTKYISTKGEWI